MVSGSINTLYKDADLEVKWTYSESISNEYVERNLCCLAYDIN